MSAKIAGTMLAFAVLTGAAHADTAYPSKPVKIVLPYVPGGASDGLARTLAQRLSSSLGQQFIVENKPGGNTIIGALAVAKSEADGYTLLFTAESTLTMNPMLYSALPYNVEKDFAPVASLARVPQSFVVRSNLPTASMREFLAYAKQQEGKLNYGNLGVGSSTHLNMELFQREASVKITGISYKGAAPALTDLMGGHIDAMIVSTGLIAPHASAGKLKVLAVAGEKRSPLLPDAPTFAEAGLRNFSPSSWFALLAPAGTPGPTITRLNSEVNKILKDPAFIKEQLSKQGLEPIGGSPQDLATLIKTETQMWAPVIRSANIKLD
jgi:tripartite-type tricarboxylate transporter receptor subunit TctC